MLWLLERDPAPKLDQVSKSLRRWWREEKTYAVSFWSRGTVDGILRFGIETEAVLRVQHADEGPVGCPENAPVRNVDTCPLPDCDPTTARLLDAHLSPSRVNFFSITTDVQ